MQTKKFDKLVKNIESKFSQKPPPLNTPLIKKAQNLIKNGPKNLLQKKTSIENKKEKSPTLSFERATLSKKHIRVQNTFERSLNKSQETHISSATKHSNSNISVIKNNFPP